MHIRVASMMSLLLLCAIGVSAQEVKDPSEAERRLRDVRSELHQVAAQRRQLAGQRDQVAQQLRAAEQQIAAGERALQQTALQLQQETEALARLQRQRVQQSAALAERRAALARLLRAAQMAGDSPALKALLAQDRIAEAGRLLTYQGYLQRAQAERVRQLSEEIGRLQSLEADIAQRQQALAEMRQVQARQLAQLQQARQRRAALLAGIDQQYQERKAREQALGADAQALQRLLAQLRAAARAQADAQRQARAAGRASAPRQEMATSPKKTVGGASWPVAGGLLAGYGGQMPDGRRSTGVLIAASAGTPVKAVANGTVVFADWMTGYGNILILDHGNGYMSLYAYNQTLLRQPGERVQRGEVVARVGATGGQGQPALYFELRHNGAPVDPAQWLQRP